MLKIIPRFSGRILAFNFPKQRRSFMSNAFSLRETWDKRLKSPILNRIKVDDMHYELDNQFNHFGSANALDIDLFANAVNSENNIEEVEDIVHKLRLSPEAINILDSTHHAFIRLFLTFGSSDELLRVLNDRLNYGIFPDEYCTILIMDKFLKNNNYKNAAKVAALQMLQEDFSNPIIKYMALYSCLKYLENPVQWDDKVEEIEKTEDDDEEEIKVRVGYLRNPFFDDHFDLVDPYHLIGKTLIMIGQEIPGDFGRTCKLIGSGLYNKLDYMKSIIESCLNSDNKERVFKDGIDVINGHLNNRMISSEGDEKSKLATIKEEIQKMLVSLESSGLVSQENLLKMTEDNLKKTIQEQEDIEIKRQTKLYDEWEALRTRLLHEKINQLNKEKQLAEISVEKQKLKEKEEELFFFENENKIDLTIEHKYERPPKRVYLGKKKKPRVKDEVYIPPEIRQVG